MNDQEAIQRLRLMYQQSFASQQCSVVPELFGIRYAAELAHFRVGELKVIAMAATGYATYGNEIAKGRRLARYVQWKPDRNFP